MTTPTEQGDQVVTVQPVTIATDTPTATPAATVQALPGVPLLTAGANASALAAAGLLTAGGPVALAAAGVTAGAVAVGTLASRAARARSRRAGVRSGNVPGPRRTSGSAGASSRFDSPAGRRGTASTTTAAGRPTRTAGSSEGKRSTGTSSGPSSPARISKSTGTATLTKPRGGNQPTSNGGARPSTGGSSGRIGLVKPTTDRAAGTLRRTAARIEAARTKNAAKAADRSVKREEKGAEKARKESGTAAPVGAKAQSKALRRSALRHYARLTAAGAATAAVGLWHWKKKGVLGRMRSTWERLAGRAREVRAARDAAINGETTPAGQAGVPVDAVNDPRRKAQTATARALALIGRRAGRLVIGTQQHPTRTERKTMSDQPNGTFTRLSDAADVMFQAASTFDPEEMEQFQALIDDLPEAMVRVQETLRVLAELAQERLPVDPAVVDEMGSGFRAMNGVISALDEVPIVYRRVHAPDIERLENPRNGRDGERRWNV